MGWRSRWCVAFMARVASACRCCSQAVTLKSYAVHRELLPGLPPELKVAMGSVHSLSTFSSMIWLAGNHDERRESNGASQTKKLCRGVQADPGDDGRQQPELCAGSSSAGAGGEGEERRGASGAERSARVGITANKSPGAREHRVSPGTIMCDRIKPVPPGRKQLRTDCSSNPNIPKRCLDPPLRATKFGFPCHLIQSQVSFHNIYPQPIVLLAYSSLNRCKVEVDRKERKMIRFVAYRERIYHIPSLP